MILTTEQIEAVKNGEPVAISPPEVGEDCVLLRADVYARFRKLLDDVDPRAAYPAILRAWDAESALEDADLYRV
jgi:hypothetical protein